MILHFCSSVLYAHDRLTPVQETLDVALPFNFLHKVSVFRPETCEAGMQIYDFSFALSNCLHVP